MASPEVDLRGSRAKIRDVGIVVLLTVVTLGIYAIVWYYMINRELRDFGRATGDAELAQSNPTMSLLAVTLGGLVIIPAIVSYIGTTKRIQRAQDQVGEPPINGWVLVVLYVFGFFFLVPFVAIPAYVQSALNPVWGHFPRATEAGGPAALPSSGATPSPASATPPEKPSDTR